MDRASAESTSGPGDAAGAARRAEIGGGSLRGRVAGGTLVNSVFLLGLDVLSIVQGLLVARLLGASQYGVWGLLTAMFGALLALGGVGIDDKYIQQDHPDQRVAFEIAFTLQSMLCGLFLLLSLIAVPLFALLYGAPKIIGPGILLSFGFPLIALQTPMWVFYRRMLFARQRVLQSVQPLVAFTVTIGLAIAGFGYWALVIGTFASSVAAAAVAVLATPYPLRLRYERGAMREYASFSWPLMLAALGTVVAFQVPITLASRLYGSAAVGAIALAASMTQYTTRADDAVTNALYPAICAVKDRTDLLYESFSKSNRLALLWGFPIGLAAAIFARPAVDLVLGERWRLAVPLIEVLGLAAAVDQIGFNWSAFARARAETRILAVGSFAFFGVMLAVGIPLLLFRGLSGFAIGIGAGTLAQLIVRGIYLTRLFPALSIGRHVLRAICPALLASAAVLALRAELGAHGGWLQTGLEAGGFLVIVVPLTWLAERALLRESIGYLRRAVARRRAVVT